MQEMMQEIMPFVSKNIIMCLAWLGLLVAVIYMSVKLRLSKTSEVTNNELTRLVNQENAIVVDTRSAETFRHGHIVDSINLIASDIKNNNLGELNKHKEQPVIIVCPTGVTSVASANALVKLGFNKVFVLKGGLDSWNAANLPLVRSKGK